VQSPEFKPQYSKNKKKYLCHLHLQKAASKATLALEKKNKGNQNRET
jgi:hypothetical protein